jgi:hypothetical protein
VLRLRQVRYDEALAAAQVPVREMIVAMDHPRERSGYAT